MNDVFNDPNDYNSDMDKLGAALDAGPFDLKLATLRAQHPYIPIFRYPDSVLAYALTANQAQEVVIPDGAKLIRFVGKGDYYVQRNGNAAVPTTTANTDTKTTGAMYKPEFAFFSADELRSLSIITADAGVIVTVLCFYG